MNYKLETLKNGLKLLVVPMLSLESATLTVWVKVGSRFESEKIQGLAHFIEHMSFKGSRKRPTAKAISEVIDGIGGEVNAATSKEWTNFYIKSRTGSLETAFDVLGDMVLNPILDEAEVEREKGVILEEKKMIEDNPMNFIGDLFERLMFEGMDLGRDIIGTVESVKGLKKQDFVDYRNDHYFTDNILLTVSGGVKVDEAVTLAEKYFGDIKDRENDEQFKKSSLTLQDKPRVLVHNKKSEQANLILGFRGNPLGHKDRFTEAIISSILGGGMSSRLFIEVRERRGLAYAVKTSADHYTDTGYIATYAGVELGKIDDAIRVILEEHQKLMRPGEVSAEELKKTKEYLKGHLALSLEDTRAVNYFFGERQLLLGKIETPDQIFEAIDKVSLDDIVRVAGEIFNKNRLNLAIIGPYEDESRFEKLLN